MEPKQPKTIEEQIKILENRGLKINSHETARTFLARTNYYTLSGYLFPFLSDKGKYTDKITFEKVCKIYDCDKRFKNIVLYALDEIEQTIKTKISYYLAHNIGSTGYLEKSNFKNTDEYNNFKDKFDKVVQDNCNLLFVKHHIEKYNNTFPIWVAIDLFTMGMLKHFFLNLNTTYQKEIAKEFGMGVNVFSNWLTCIVYLRNLSAHYRRLYNFKLQRTPIKDKKDSNPQTPTYKVYDIIYVMKKFFLFDKESWNNFILPSFEHIFLEYNDAIELTAYGFEDKWLNNLKIK